MNKKQETDDRRSFPGYATATDLLDSWVDTLRAQASGWNDLWAKLRAGKAGFGDWTKVFVESAEAYMSFSEHAWSTMRGPGAPPWVTFRLPAKEVIPVRILKPVDPSVAIEPVRLTLLGGQRAEEPREDGRSLSVRVVVKGPYDLSLSIDDAILQDFVLKDGQLKVPDCQYIGLVLSPKHADPLAVVSFVVSRADLERSQNVDRDRMTPNILKNGGKI
jgi:hypothetical protein